MRIRAFWSVPTYRFAVLFLAFLVAVSLAYPWVRMRHGAVFAALEVFTAKAVYRLMALFSDDVRMLGDTIVYYGPFPVKIIDECSGVYEAALLGAALLAFPTSWTKSALGFLMGFPMIYAMNLARIVMLLVVGRYFPHAFEFLHIYFWQVTMIAMVASTWLLWVLWVVRSDGPESASSGEASS
jgi:exosortase H (IPTLxxWG-CTERM-specific)